MCARILSFDPLSCILKWPLMQVLCFIYVVFFMCHIVSYSRLWSKTVPKAYTCISSRKYCGPLKLARFSVNHTISEKMCLIPAYVNLTLLLFFQITQERDDEGFGGNTDSQINGNARTPLACCTVGRTRSRNWYNPLSAMDIQNMGMFHFLCLVIFDILYTVLIINSCPRILFIT